MRGSGVVLAAALVFPFVTFAAGGEGLDGEFRRFDNELRDNQAVLSPGMSSHLASERNRLDQMPDRDEAARQLRALESEMAFSHTGLPGASSTLMGPMGGFPNVYAPSDTLSSPTLDRKR
jgi:hypothetical protein